MPVDWVHRMLDEIAAELRKPIEIIGRKVDAIIKFTILGLTGDNYRSAFTPGQDSLRCIQSHLAFLLLRPVAFNAGLRQDGLDASLTSAETSLSWLLWLMKRALIPMQDSTGVRRSYEGAQTRHVDVGPPRWEHRPLAGSGMPGALKRTPG